MGNHSTNNGYTVSDTDKYAATADAWGKSSATTDEGPYDFTTSSGKLCLIRNLGMTDILRMGLLDTLDFFTKSLSEDEKKQKNLTGEAGEQFTKALLGNFDKMDETINKVVLAGVIQPVLSPVPDAGPTGTVTRVEGVIYVDKIPFEDRVELFGEIMDTEGLSSFRQKSEAGVGDVPADESVQDATV